MGEETGRLKGEQTRKCVDDEMRSKREQEMEYKEVEGRTGGGSIWRAVRVMVVVVLG